MAEFITTLLALAAPIILVILAVFCALVGLCAAGWAACFLIERALTRWEAEDAARLADDEYRGGDAP